MALGGLGEVGLNLMVMECKDDIIIIDCGVLFPDLFWLGLDLVLPDLPHLIENQKKIKRFGRHPWTRRSYRSHPVSHEKN